MEIFSCTDKMNCSSFYATMEFASSSSPGTGALRPCSGDGSLACSFAVWTSAVLASAPRGVVGGDAWHGLDRPHASAGRCLSLHPGPPARAPALSCPSKRGAGQVWWHMPLDHRSLRVCTEHLNRQKNRRETNIFLPPLRKTINIIWISFFFFKKIWISFKMQHASDQLEKVLKNLNL